MYNKKNLVDDLIYPELSYKIVGILFSVFNDLGSGYKEKYYEKAIAQYLKNRNIDSVCQAPYQIREKDEIIGRQYLDFLIENKIILEIKRGNYFSIKNIQQVNIYLKVTNLRLAILANFTPHGIKFKRLVNIK